MEQLAGRVEGGKPSGPNYSAKRTYPRDRGSYGEIPELLEGRVRRGVFMNWAVTKADMAKVHQDDFAWFLDLVEWHDPDGKFANEFTRRLFGHGAQPHH
jgi:hypothetical protein